MNPQPHIALSAGEASGDRLGAALIEGIRAQCPGARFSGIAGPRMREAGCHPLAHSEALSVMGLAEVVQHLPRLLGLRRRIARALIDRPPQVFIGIDAPDFNLGLARRLRRNGIPTLHWVSPAVWAWRRYRVKRIAASVDRLLTLFPFEASFYREHGVAANYVGHPLADEIDGDCGQQTARDSLGLEAHTTTLALLPGSRRNEIERLLPVFLRALRLCRDAMPHLQAVLPVASESLLPVCRRILHEEQTGERDVHLVLHQSRQAMCAADAVLLASGTATLEALLLRRPMVVAYRLHPLSYALVRRLLHIPRVSLPNILLQRPQVPEFLQAAATAENLAPAILKLLRDPDAAATQTAPFDEVHRRLQRQSVQRVTELVLRPLCAE